MNIHQTINRHRLDGDEAVEILLLLSVMSISLGLMLLGFGGFMVMYQ